MIGVLELSKYFKETNKQLPFADYNFKIAIQEETETFVINLKISQKDSKQEHLIKFRFGIGKDKAQRSESHPTNKPHFEIEFYRREEESFSATVYFTLPKASDEDLLDYAKGTVAMIDKILKQFIQSRNLDPAILKGIVFEEAIITQLSAYEPKLIKALYDCYRHSDLVVWEDGQRTIIKTPHILEKYLGGNDLQPFFLPIMDKIRHSDDR